GRRRAAPAVAGGGTEHHPRSGPGSPPGVGSLTPTLLNASQVTPVPVPPSGDGRRRGLAAALARLQGVYAEHDELKDWRFNTTLFYGFLLGLVVGFLVGEFAHAVQFNTGYFPAAFRAPPFDWLSVVLGIGAGLAVWGGYVWVIRSGVRAVADDLRGKAEGVVGEVAADFPDEVAAWGGRAALRHPATVRQLREELDPPARPAASPTSDPSAEDLAADPTRKALLVARLKDHDATLKAAADAVTHSWPGAFFLGIGAAFGAGAGAYHAVVEPAARGDGVYHSYNQVPAAVAAALAGLAAAALVYWVMWAVRRYFRRRAEASRDRLAADYPRLVEAWGGRVVLESRQTVAALTRMLDPAGADKPGWLRRLFGG
ncbi:MAG: hypothetical protein K2X87_00400, partial [Gemmataceae bacterium]|nr:hypothetical protein [Gemmataceae bacterium]